jgi:hypothetical protein
VHWVGLLCLVRILGCCFSPLGGRCGWCGGSTGVVWSCCATGWGWRFCGNYGGWMCSGVGDRLCCCCCPGVRCCTGCLCSLGFLLLARRWRPCSHLVGSLGSGRSLGAGALLGIGCFVGHLAWPGCGLGRRTGVRCALGAVGLALACFNLVVRFLLVMALLLADADCLPGLQSLLGWWSCVHVYVDDVVLIGLKCSMISSLSMQAATQRNC